MIPFLEREDNPNFDGGWKQHAPITDLGNGIWASSGRANPPTAIINDRLHFRFLDYLYIPSRTSELTVNQIVTINRFRERTIATDPQFSYRTKIRNLFSRALAQLGNLDVVEVGPGKYPLRLANYSTYSAIEIDPIAIQHLKSQGLKVASPVAAFDQFDICVGLFVFHFDVSASALQCLGNSMRPGGAFLFNVPTSLVEVRTLAISRLSSLGISSVCIDLMPGYGKNDAIFVCHRGSLSGLSSEIHQTILKEIDQGASYDGRALVVGHFS